MRARPHRVRVGQLHTVSERARASFSVQLDGRMSARPCDGGGCMRASDFLNIVGRFDRRRRQLK